MRLKLVDSRNQQGASHTILRNVKRYRRPRIKKVVHIHALLVFMYYCTMRLVLYYKLNEATRTRELYQNTKLYSFNMIKATRHESSCTIMLTTKLHMVSTIIGLHYR